MNNRLTSVVIVLLLVVAGFIGFITFEPEIVKAATTIYVGSGPGNDTTSIQDAIDNYSRDGDTIFVYSGTYFENVVVDKTINLTGEDRENTIIDARGSGDVVYVNTDWVNITGFTATGSGSNADAAIGLDHAENCKVFDNNLSFNGHWGVRLEFSNGTTIEDNKVINNEAGMYFRESKENIISNNNISSAYDNGIDFRYSSDNNTVTDNIILNTRNWGISVRTSNNYIIGNTISVVEFEGIHVHGSNNSIINNNVSNNNLGIYIHTPSLDNIISNNNISNNNHSIYLCETSNNVIKNNYITGSYFDGIKVESSFSNQFINNTVLQNEFGFKLLSSSHNNTISNNICNSNSQYGISLWSSDNNTINGNSLSNNLCAIGLDLSSNNTIYHNNIINNVFQATDGMDDNIWNESYPSGGNYWSDWTTPDTKKGPNQDIPGSDGIVDNPYVIDAGSIDYYPLYSPYVPLFLYEGWNLISIPFIQSDTNLGKVLEPINGSYDAVQWYNISDSSDHWKHNHIFKPSHLNDLNDINHTMGFWIHITEPGGVIFEYEGTRITRNQNISLHVGWNMVGFPSLSNYNRTSGLKNLTFGIDVDCIQWYDAGTKTWHFMGPDDYFVPGRGYWIHSIVRKVWNVPFD